MGTSDEAKAESGKDNQGDVSVESKEKERGRDIIVDEKRLPSQAAAVHEQIRLEGEKELERDAWALLWSAVAAGLSMGASLMAKGTLHARLEGIPGRFLLENFGYTLGFVIVIMARQQLFTENTIKAVLPIMHRPTRGNFLILFRLWGIVLVGNLLGTALVAYFFLHLSAFDQLTQAAFVSISQEVMRYTPGEMLSNAIISGWIIATMVWMLPAAGAARLWVIIMMTYLMALGNVTHIVVGSVEIFYLVFSGHLPWQNYLYPFALPTLAGNIIGGTFIFTLISHAQIRSDLSREK